MEGALKVEPAPGDPEFLSNFADSISFTLFCRETVHSNYKILGLQKGFYASLEYHNIADNIVISRHR